MKVLVISGEIGWDVMPDQVRQALAEANGEPVEVVVSSPGGFVSDGIEIFNLIRNYSGETVARLSGYAMSMASYIPLACDRIVAEDNAVYMIHNVRGGVWGDHNDILHYGGTCKSLSGMLAKAYARKTGKPLEEIQALMDRETFFFGEEMVDAGFVDDLIEAAESTDRDTATAVARLALDDCSARMSAEVGRMRDDLTRAAAMSGASKHKQKVATAATENQGGVDMTLEELRAKHPDLVAAIVAEAKEGTIGNEELQQQLETARAEGAKSERDRVEECRAQSMPGHEELVETMAFDGKSSGADVALAIVAAEKGLREKFAQDLEDDANAAAAHANGDDVAGKTMKLADFNKLDQADQRAFIKDGGKTV